MKTSRLLELVRLFQLEQACPGVVHPRLVTNDWLKKYGRAQEQWTKAQYAALGIYPPPKGSGWKSKLIGKRISERAAKEFEKLKASAKRLRRLPGKPSWHSAITLKPMSYREYLQSDAWALKREQVFAKYGRKCVDCGRTDNLQVHHKTYKRLFQERLSDLEPVCPDHHLDRHPELLADKMFKEFQSIVD